MKTIIIILSIILIITLTILTMTRSTPNHPPTRMKIGYRVKMTSESSNWNVEEMGTVTQILDGKVVIELDTNHLQK